MLFQEGWLGRTRAWDAILEEWQAGELGVVTPRGDAMFAFGGLRSINDWAIERGEQRQRELV
eukprot:SAG31_NODE_65_length_28565_cov_8.402914_15_plen_62_part_00